ncbi:MAG: D-alanyl-D-alanine carboxypeptidase/D-alanyl-D-alanine-endopeptidase [Muribaculaceae bacterium]|nr:D-alanyl-D-alanine carboxypeptidase/D-alanyl-D-alanine-endopeptidase [Muribaculaceae bacterium]
MKHFFFKGFVFAAALALSAQAARPDNNNNNILGLADGDATTVGIYIKDLATGKVIVDHNSSLALTPASVTKIVTSASAMLTVGPDYRFTTDITLSGQRSGSDRSRWEGDLIINSCGDPTIGSSEFKSTVAFSDSIVAGVQRLGIKEITGTVIILETMKDPGALPTWECEDIAWPYGAGLFGFNYRGNYVKAFPANGTTNPPTNLKITLLPSPGDRNDQLRGINSENLTVWANAATRRKKDWSINTTNPDPAASYVTVLASKLRAAGIKVGEKAVTDRPHETAVKVYTHQSPTAAEICRNLMKRSDNLFAEGMLRVLDPGGSREDCIKAERDLWKARGLMTSRTVINDGSGLTRANRFSPRFLGGLLESMLKSQVADIYVDFFPVAGIDGTMKGFGDKTTLKGRMAMKTGSISSVQSYAGYRLDPDGHPTHIVVIMINGFFGPRSAVKGRVEKFLLETFK